MAEGMQAAGAYVEVLPSLRSFFGRVKKSVTGQSVDVDVSPKVNQGDLIKAKQQVEKAADGVAKARQKEADAAGAVRAAEARLETLRESGKARADQLVAAEERVEKSKRASATASEALNRAEGAQRTATRKVERIEADLKVNSGDAEQEVRGFAARAKAALGALRGKVDVDTESGEQEVRGFGGRVRSALSQFGGEAGGAAGGGIASGLAGKAMAVGAAGVAIGGLLVAGVTQAMDIAQGRAKLTAQLGLVGEDAQTYGAMAGRLYSGAFGTDMGEVNEALRQVTLNIGGLGDMSSAELERISGKVLNLSSTFGVDLQAATGAVGTMLKNGLAPNADVALDIVTTGFQSGADKAGDFLDTLTEYSGQFSKFGLDGATATGLLTQGLQAGARDADFVADAIKEFSIRAVDGSKTTSDGFRMIGLNAQDMAAKIARGGPEAAGALDLTLDRLRAMPDPVQRSQAAVALFGTKAEDLGSALFALDPSTAVNTLGQVGGAADAMGQTLQETSSARIESFKRTLQTGLVDFIGGAVLPIFDVLGNVGSSLFGSAWGPVKDFLGFLAGTGGTIATVIGIIAAVTWAWTAASAALNTTFLASPIFWIIAAIIGLVAIVVYAYKNWDWFRTAVDACWQAIATVITWAWTNIIQPVFSAIGAIFMWLWSNIISPVVDFIVAYWRYFALALAIVLGPVGLIIAAFLLFRDQTVAVLTAVGGFFSWLWSAILWPILSAIGTALAYLGLAIFTILVTPFVIAWNIISAIVTWAWNTIIYPVLQAIWNFLVSTFGPVFTWLWGVVTMVWNGIVAQVQIAWAILSTIFGVVVAYIGGALAAAWRFLWNGVIVPVWNGIVAAIQFAWGIISSIFNAVVGFLQSVFGPVFTWLLNNIILPVWNGIRAAISTAWDFIRGVFDVGMRAVDAVGRAFQFVADWIGRAWASIREAARGPIQFVVDVVYNNGIRKVWNGMAGMFGMGQLPDIRMDEGGVLPGYTPGQDVHQFVSPTGGRLALSGGEGILVPEAVRALGPAFVGWANRTFSGGRSSGGVGTPRGYSGGGVVRRFADGGILGGIGSFVGNIGDFFGTLFSDPAAAIKKAFSFVVGDAGRTPGAGGWTEALKKLPGKAIDGIVAKVKKWVDDLGAMGGNIGGAGVQRWTPVVLQALGMVGQPASLLPVVLRRMNQESGGNPAAINLWDSNAKKGIPSKGLMQVIDPTFNAYAGPLRGLGVWNPLANIYASMRYAMSRYGSLAAAYNKAGGYDEGGLATDRGVLLKQTVSPERVLSPQQTRNFEKLSDALDRGELTGLSKTVTTVRATLGDLRTQLDALIMENGRRAAAEAAAAAAAAAKPITRTIVEPTKLALAAREALAAMNRGAAIFEDFSFRGMSRGFDNDALADGFYVNGQQFDGSAKTRADVRRYLERVAGQTTTRTETVQPAHVAPVGPAATANPSATVGPAVPRARVEGLETTNTGQKVEVNVYGAQGQDPEDLADHTIRKLEWQLRK